MTTGRWVVGGGAVVVLAASAAWVVRPADVDDRLWAQVRPAIEARLVAASQGTGYGESVPRLDAHWFCEAEALELDERDGVVRAGVDTFCVEYGVRAASLVECSSSRFPQVVRLKRGADGGYRVLTREEPPDGEGYARWTSSHFGHFAVSELGGAAPEPTALEAAARTHFGLPADAPVSPC
ncbi:hypothetical protein ACIPSE_36890 [Streptomyces sp. NPDC090106]|uniref:hypothetical protein n=1 Tax=Streptomyces sp. NPDC090106 TaxID=3365946 RepID=UPI00382E6125